MRAAKHDAEHDPISNQILTVSEILRILAITGPGASADRGPAALAREAAKLRALEASGADAGRLRECALRGVAMAEASVRAQSQEALRAGAIRPRRLVALARVGRSGLRSPARVTHELDEDALLRERSQELLNKLAILRHELTYADQAAPASSPSHRKPAKSTPR